MPKITKIGSSHGVVIPARTLVQANLMPDDAVVIAPLQDGVLVASEQSAAGLMISGMLDSMDRFAESYRILSSERLSDES